MYIGVIMLNISQDNSQKHPIMLIDAKNALYKSIWAIKNNKRPGVKNHYFTAFLRQLTKWMNYIRPSSIHLFWDAPRNTVWRKNILSTYKDRTASSNYVDITDDLAELTVIVKDFAKYMNIRQYERKHMEADDLIYSAVSVLHPLRTIIISSDSDMVQIPFRFSSSSVIDAAKSMDYIAVPQHNPVYIKSLVGDTSDCIDGYYGIGPMKSAAMLEDRDKLRDYFKLKGSELFNRNILLVDLSMCPQLLANTLYVHKQLADDVSFDRSKIVELINTHKVYELHAEFADLIIPFSKINVTCEQPNS